LFAAADGVKAASLSTEIPSLATTLVTRAMGRKHPHSSWSGA
jgi:hypothetical protein